jgi:hypothetical protein
MKMMILIIIVVVVFSALGLWLITCGNATSEGDNMIYGISMMTNKTNYSVGEPIIMTLKIFNCNEEEIIFHFNNSQRYDFIIKDEEGNEIWRWSKDRMFAMMLGEEVLGPTNTEIIYTVEYKGKLGAGYYKVTGIFVAREKPMSGSIIIEMK